jgi:cyclic-di-GMP-binding protein
MPSFDTVSEVDMHEINNAIDQANREVGTRFDFKGIDASFTLTDESVIQVAAEVEFQAEQMLDILRNKAVKRGIDVKALKEGDMETSGQRVTLPVKIQQGIDQDLARKIVKTIKEAKLKVQASIQGDKVRVTGKKRDDLQQVIALLKDAKFGIPLQFNNFRD